VPRRYRGGTIRILNRIFLLLLCLLLLLLTAPPPPLMLLLLLLLHLLLLLLLLGVIYVHWRCILPNLNWIAVIVKVYVTMLLLLLLLLRLLLLLIPCEVIVLSELPLMHRGPLTPLLRLLLLLLYLLLGGRRLQLPRAPFWKELV
jgi:hypothetical protein